MKNMDVNGILEKVQNIDLREILFELGSKSHVLTQNEIVALAIAALVGVMICFLGWKLVRFWAAVFGFAAGGILGCVAASAFGMQGGGVLIAGAAAGFVILGLSAGLYKFGIFLTVFLTVLSAGVCLTDPKNWIIFGVCAAAALVFAAAAVKFAAVITITATSAFGSIISGIAVSNLLPYTNRIIEIALCIVLFVLGVWIQMLLESKRQKRRNLKKAEEIREESSAANEVERARALIDEAEIPQSGEKDSEDAWSENADDLEIIELGDDELSKNAED